VHQDTCLYSFIGAVVHFASRSSYLAWLFFHLFGWCWWALGWEHDCFYYWAICFFCLGLLPIAFDSSTRFASAFHSASLRLVSRPALPSQLKPPMGVRFASTLIDESLGMNFQLDLSRYANLSLFFTWFCFPAFSLLHSGVALLEFNLTSLVFYHLPGFHCFFSPIVIWQLFSHVLSRIYSFI